MPKKFGINDKQAEAKARKDAQKKETQEKVKKAKEDALWVENDPKILQKLEKKKQEEEKKKAEAAKRAELKALQEKEEREMQKLYHKPTDTKLTRAMIEEQRLKEEQAKIKQQEKLKKQENDLPPIEENINHILAIQQAEFMEDGVEVIDARTVADALSLLKLNDGADKHPEKRMKAAFTAYQSQQLPILRKENPSLKLSQVKEMLWKQWLKAPENPMNQQ